MGRSKFPGKPSKHTNRKRINVLPPTSELNIESNPLTVETVVENKQDDDKNEDVTSNNLNSKVSLRRRLKRKLQNSKTKRNGTNRTLVTKVRTKNGMKTKMKTKKKLKIKTVQRYTNMKNVNKTKENGSHVGKFVLPTRSVHSSRVIKPNKRFLNVDLSDTMSFKNRVLKKHCLKSAENQAETGENEPHNETPPEISESSSNSPNPIGRVVLRQARLKLHSQPSTGPEGPFSSSSNGSPPGTVTCGVCGAVRFYRFVKQARKFNIYSCESCRKFISKMIKRQSCGKSTSTLVCHEGQGMCHVPPIVRSQHWKLIRCAYRARCPACWLKMCLRSFQMPLSLKNNLVQLLPKNMQSADVVFTNSLPLMWQTNLSNNTETRNKNTNLRQRPVRFKNNPASTSNNKTTIVSSSDIKRQKVDLKGPRVKHVCRSASIVLGQPLATFPPDVEKKNDCNQLETKKIDDASTPIDTRESDQNEYDRQLKLSLPINDTISLTRRDKNPKNSLPISMSYEKKRNTDLQNTISIDFWENYDPDEIFQNGFCLIASKQFPMPAICFLCGSAGRESLLHCSLCCEPYHIYCLEQNPPITYNSKESIWLCPKCTVCKACNKSDRQKLNCQKCLQAYHPECFNTKWSSDDRPTVCSKCLACKSCGAENITKFIGNIPLCMICFKLREKGNFCPICQCCYDGNDFCIKMMECMKCKKWIHAKCENLSEEYYQILSHLPDSIEYLCSLCSNGTTPYWRKAIESELNYNFNQVLRLLSKNRIAKNTLKWSPLNPNRALNRMVISTGRKLQFSDCYNEDEDENETSLSDCDNNNSNRSENEIVSTSGISMFYVKNKLNTGEYTNVKEFDRDMKEALKLTQSGELIDIYSSIIRSVFPWYESNDNDTEIHVQIDESPKKIAVKESVNPDENLVVKDSRYCSFCKIFGDGFAHQESRLLYCGQNEWVHANCALWSSEVYEEIDGSLQNVHSALNRGRSIRCSSCRQKGASVGCCFKGCHETYHFLCARNAKCFFMHDKTVFCPQHELPENSSIISTPTDFDIRRSVYVELDKKRGKYSQIDKVNVMVGSLCVKNLGKINPSVSDSAVAIIPTGFVCSRLYWSTIEPWKLVSYNITTSVLNSHSNTCYIDKNFTIDHTLPEQTVDQKLKELNNWQKDIDKKNSDIIEFDDDDEPQNGADLLSPEITDAIYEEIPRELLDGISVDDIFPKLLSYEDLVNVDYKNDDTLDDFGCKKTDIEEDTDFSNNRGLKRSKSEDMDKLNKNKTQQRSCSLTLSCKLDNAFSPAMKKRKIASRENNLFFQLLQVDGNFDDSSSDCESTMGLDKCEEPVRCEICRCTYRTQASYKRHLDNCEVISTSESDSEITQEQENQQMVVHEETDTLNLPEGTTVVVDNAQPVVLASYESYQNEIHTSVLNTQTFVTSKTSELISVPQTLPVNGVTPISLNQSLVSETSNEQQTYAITQPTALTLTEPLISNNQTQFCVNQTVPLCVNPQIIQPNVISVNSMPLNQTIEFQSPSVTIQQVPYTNNMSSPILNVTSPQNQITLNGKIIAPGLLNSVLPSNQWVKSIPKQPIISTKPLKAKTRGRIAIKRNKDDDTVIVPSSSTPLIVQQIPSTNFIPFVDAFQQQPNQNVQYVTTIAPQPAQPLVQIQPDSNLISLLPGIQPMFIQQPRVVENQLVLDSNGSLSWSPQTVQPIYYGFETIVQNTVMQSQQFLPTTVPGILTANSSYSTTTQVFQSSKLEPVLDVGSNSFVLLNPGQLVNSQTIEMAQNTAPQLITNPIQPNPVRNTESKPVQLNKYPPNRTNEFNINTNSINLPTAPLVSEQRIPTNIVTPTPKTNITNQNRPMSRVLPMQTSKEIKKIKYEPPKILMDKEIIPPIKTSDTLTEFEKLIEKTVNIQEEKNDNTLKLIFQKQSQDGTYKVNNVSKSMPLIDDNLDKLNDFTTNNNKLNQVKDDLFKLNNFITTKNPPVQVAPLKPIKSSTPPEKPCKKPGDTPKFLQPPEKKDNLPTILYTIETQDGFKHSSTSITDLWNKVFETVQNVRAAHNMPLLPTNANVLNSIQLLGLNTSSLKYLIEQLPGAAKCIKYKPTFNFHKIQTDSDDDCVIHGHGSVRVAPNFKRVEPYDMFSWLASKHRKPEYNSIYSDLISRRSSVNLPMAMRFRQLKLTYKYSVGVYRSKIHRRGLFCLRDFEAGEMVIEYSGEVIRSILTDKREKLYNSKGIGCYMFRIDDNLVVDATMKGNAARFINHSCDPNCYSKVVEILGHKHIIIFALRKIISGEELTYDYKFPIEEDKIPCTCGARRCRKFLN